MVYFSICSAQVFEQCVKVLSEVTADALPQHVVQPIGIVFVHQTVTKHSEYFVDPQSKSIKTLIK